MNFPLSKYIYTFLSRSFSTDGQRNNEVHRVTNNTEAVEITTLKTTVIEKQNLQTQSCTSDDTKERVPPSNIKSIEKPDTSLEEEETLLG